MSVRINVEPTRLEHSAAQIEQKAQEYQRHYQRLFQHVEAMSATWKGKDHQAFIQQIRGFENDFKAMQLLMKEYAGFLRVSAKAYRDMQSERVAQARRLIN